MTASKSQQLTYISSLINQCRKCHLYQDATHAVPGSGNPEAKIVFVGEAPGFFEDKSGLPFVGNAGKLLDKLLASIDISRKDVFICNILKHRPPLNRDPLPEEIQACTPFLKAQLKVLQPKLIVALGGVAMNYFFPGELISRIRGQIKEITWEGMNLTIIPVYHPAAALRNGAMLLTLEEDFQTIGNFLIFN